MVSDREFLVDVYGPLFGALGRLALPTPVRLIDFVNEPEGFLRLKDVEFMADGDMTMTPQLGPMTTLSQQDGDRVDLPASPRGDRTPFGDRHRLR